MSVVINYVSKYLSIIISDNRISFGKNAEFGWVDGQTKLVNIPNMGWCSGVGLADFLNEFKEKLSRTEINKLDEISDLFSRTIDDVKKNKREFINEIENSAISVSWIGTDQQDIIFRLGILSKEHFNNKLILLPDDTIYILYPSDYVDDTSKVEELEKEFEMTMEYNWDLESVLNKLLNIFHMIATKSPSVSKTCDIGLQFASSEGIFKAKVSGNIHDLIADLVHERLGQRIEIVHHTKFNFNGRQ
jgi:hypothetical protein